MCRWARTRSSIWSWRATSPAPSTAATASSSSRCPSRMIFGEATRVMCLRDGTKKMSKSDASDYSRINMTDDADAIALKIRKAKTDPQPLPREREALPRRGRRPTICSASTRRWPTSAASEAVARFAGQDFSDFKSALAELSVAKCSADRRRDAAPDGRSRLYRRRPARGAERANAIAQPHLAKSTTSWGCCGCSRRIPAHPRIADAMGPVAASLARRRGLG